MPDLRSIAYPSIWIISALALGYGLIDQSYGLQGGVLVALGLVIMGMLLVIVLAKSEGSRWFLTILAGALILKLIASLLRMSANELFFGGQFDSGRYFNAGGRISRNLLSGDFAEITPQFQTGTPFAEFYSGILQTITGPTLSGEFMAYGILAFVGSYFFYKAAKIAVPLSNLKLYAILIFFWPTLVYWSNGIGKDALMALFMGLTAYGAATTFPEIRGKGLVLLTSGLLGVFTIRPHIATLLVAALVVALVLGYRGEFARKPLKFLAAILILIGIASFIIPRGFEFTGVQEVSLDAIVARIERQQGFSRGGSAFTPPSITAPSEIPLMIATVLVRPFPWEAHNVQAMVQAAEGILLLTLILWRIRSLGSAILAAKSVPFLLFAIVFIVLFIPVFAGIANFGTLARERAMVLPFLFMLLAYRPASIEAKIDHGNPQGLEFSR